MRGINRRPDRVAKFDHAAKFAEVRAPRYTSYPTAPMFGPLDGKTFGGWLENLPAEDELSLYIHVPFCRELCWFCGCHTEITSRQAPLERYLKTLLMEIDLAADRLGAGRQVRHLHFGGGSPTVLSPQQFTAIMDRIHARFTIAPDAELAVEMDPRTTEPDKIAAFAATGINRASLGVQDFDPAVQRAIHRIQPLEQVAKVIRWLKDAGIDHINMDLMYGLPRQHRSQFTRTIADALYFKPARISLFAYAHVPWMKKHQKMIDETALPSGEERLEMRATAERLFRAAGYIAIGMDHYARPDDSLSLAAKSGTLHRNFQGYTVDAAVALIAFGPSGISRLPAGYAQNDTDLKGWHQAILARRLPVIRGHTLTTEDRLYGEVIERLMCDGRIDLAGAASRHGVKAHAFDSALGKLKQLAAEGVIEITGCNNGTAPVIRVNADLPMAARLASACFDQYLTATEAVYSKVI